MYGDFVGNRFDNFMRVATKTTHPTAAVQRKRPADEGAASREGARHAHFFGLVRNALRARGDEAAGHHAPGETKRASFIGCG